MLVPRASQVLRLYKAQACRIHRTMASAAGSSSWFDPLDTFTRRHVGPDRREEEKMLSALGYASMADFENAAVPAHIRVASGSVSDFVNPI
jgi:glycine dehydrogenase